MQKHFKKFAKTALILVYLVIIAGAVVRMTGSGMGCPDWPKCFGYYIPPTDEAVLEWQENRAFEKGQVIIYEESLKIAKSNFTTTKNFNNANWEDYTKHDYAIFNVWHTWIEYINRLLGALAGLATLVLAIASLWFWKKNKVIPILSWLVVFGMGFQAWLGATVVYSVLEPVKITLHMMMALIIVAMLLYIIFKASKSRKNRKNSNLLIKLLGVAIILTLIQIVLGTQVRQFVDHQIDLHGEQAKNLWLQKPELQFYIHRSFSVLVVLLNLYIAFLIHKSNLGYKKINWVLILLLSEIISGITMYYMNFPFGSQTIHLVMASLLFGAQFYLVLEAINAKRSVKTL
ncbi:COX15/CtaA family protein [Cellulophaga tyrosinoxydans]|uniref:Cytochrome c oxidase assembly protein subunit 15 n=1 Tax=Cellulophaga tyrosinoxydans TaxID=504486 RepID=A0A1W2AIQ3_9FLAO|nr:COX15/CtaA family protein [Cellulophaga tyrosinoxydans]SMC60504.1 cytochrome c oxidase assembly protein subunit 15 [Cellulophaga tyrosinoxydans]